MAKIRKVYTAEFRREAVRVLESSGESAAQIGRDPGIGGRLTFAVEAEVR